MRARQLEPTPRLVRQHQFDKEVVRAAATGNWPRVFAGLGILLDKQVLLGRHGPCPGCGGKDRLRFDDVSKGAFICSGGGTKLSGGDGFDFVRHVQGVSFPEALRRVALALNLQTDALTPQPAAPSVARSTAAVPSRTDARDLQRIMDMVERGARPTTDGEVAAYLRDRGLASVLDDIPTDLLEHPPTDYWQWPDNLGEFPMMLGVIRSSDGEILNVHRTYLQQGAKAPVPEPRKLARRKISLSGAAIRLYEATDRLALAEGIESALAVRAMTGLPTWSCVSATLMPHVLIPETVRVLDIYADNDQAGLSAAERLRERIAVSGVIVQVHVPSVADSDPLDWYLQQRGKRAQSAAASVVAAEHERQRGQRSRRLSGDKCKCSVCGSFFNSTTAFEEHRTGAYGRGRRCLTPDEMQARGMRLSADDWWLTSH